MVREPDPASARTARRGWRATAGSEQKLEFGVGAKNRLFALAPKVPKRSYVSAGGSESP